MAILNENGNYIRIHRVHIESDIDYRIYGSEQIRDIEYSGGSMEFYNIVHGTFNSSVLNDILQITPPISTETILNNLKIMGYILMLCDFSAFPNATLDQETLNEINNMSSEQLEQFTNCVDFLLNKRLDNQEDKDLVKSKIFGV